MRHTRISKFADLADPVEEKPAKEGKVSVFADLDEGPEEEALFEDEVSEPAFSEDFQAILEGGTAQPTGTQFINELIKPAIQDPVGKALKPGLGFVADVGSGVLRAGAGVKQGVAELVSRAGGLPGELREPAIEHFITGPEVERQERFAGAREEVLGAEPGFGEILGQAAVPVPGASQKVNALKRMFQATLGGGAAGALEFTEGGSANRGKNVLFGIAGGTGFQTLAEGFGFAGRVMTRAGRLAEATGSRLLNRVEQRDIMQAAKDLGIVVTPGEVSGDILLVAGESNLILNRATREDLQDFLMDRHDQLVRNIDSLKKSAIKGSSFNEHQAAIAALEPDVLSFTLDQEQLTKLLNESPAMRRVFTVVRKARSKTGKLTESEALLMEKYRALQVKLGTDDALPLTNVGFIDLAMKDFDNMVSKTAGGAEADFAILAARRKKISDLLKEEVPGYREYKALQQRALAVRHIERAIDDIPARNAGEWTSGFYSAVLAKPKTRKELIGLMADVPGAKEKIEALSKVMGAVFSDEALAKTIKTKFPDLIATGGTAGAGMIGAAAIRLKKFLGTGTDRALMEYITNPAWTTDVTSLVKRGNKLQTLNNLAAYFNRVANIREQIDVSGATSKISETLQSVL